MAQAADLGFGRVFTPHMAVARYSRATGWSDVQVVPHDALSLSPAAMVLHYGQTVFEGLKAFRHAGGSVALFRPADNAARFVASAERLAMPPLPEHLFVEACRALVRADAAHVPEGNGRSLYLRPTMIATEAALGVRPADEYLFFVIASPVSSYFASGSHPLTVWVSPTYVRAVPGGTGAAKCSGNYAASLAAKLEAAEHGCDETLWVDALERRWVEELGGMNFIAVTTGGTLVTPPAAGTILDGITLRSLVELAAALGHRTEQRPISLDELCGRDVAEAFACGTAAVVAPIGCVRTGEATAVIGDGGVGQVTARLRDELVAVQEGRARDRWQWLDIVVP